MNKTDNISPKDIKENGKNSISDIAARANHSINKARALNKKTVSVNQSDTAEKNHRKSETSQESSTSRSNANDGKTGGKIDQSAAWTANVVDASSEYIKNFDLAKTTQKVKKTIKQNPGFSFAIAGIFGLFIGLMVGRRTLR